MQFLKAAQDIYSEGGMCDVPNQSAGKDECGKLDAGRLHSASETPTARVFSDLQGHAADSKAERIDKQSMPQTDHEQLDRAGQIIASLQVVLPLIG